LIPTNFWLDDMSISSVASKGDVDDYCNLANLIFAELANLLNADSSQEDRHTGTFAASISLLWEKLQQWRRLRLRDVRPLLRNSSALSGVYPEVLYSLSSSSRFFIPVRYTLTVLPVCGNTFYHAGSLLILQTGIYLPEAQDPLYEIVSNMVALLNPRSQLLNFTHLLFVIYSAQRYVACERALRYIHVKPFSVSVSFYFNLSHNVSV
jgi:hypothetical protein